MNTDATSSTIAASTDGAPSTTTGASTPSTSSQNAFQMALSAALSAQNVLSGAGGNSDDDDDGSSLTVGNSVGL